MEKDKLMDSVDKKALADSIENAEKQRQMRSLKDNQPQSQQQQHMPQMESAEQVERRVTTENDPLLKKSFGIVPLPSKGKFYQNGIDSIEVEHLTTKDEDILSEISLIQSGRAMEVLLKNKIITPGIDSTKLLRGDTDAIAIYLRASGYGAKYKVKVYDPFNGTKINRDIDLQKIEYLKPIAQPDEQLEFTFMLPVRQVAVKFRLLNASEESQVIQNSKAAKEAFSKDYSELASSLLKAQVVEVNGKRTKDYIARFIDAMPILDSLKLKLYINDVTPGIDYEYEFIATDGQPFKATIILDVDFFFPGT